MHFKDPNKMTSSIKKNSAFCFLWKTRSCVLPHLLSLTKEVMSTKRTLVWLDFLQNILGVTILLKFFCQVLFLLPYGDFCWISFRVELFWRVGKFQLFRVNLFLRSANVYYFLFILWERETLFNNYLL